ncbi:MAG: hypothetical protein ACFBSC_15910 [Microcoleaceae cyanobacterium]
MANPNPGPYQSRAFNFLARNYQGFLDGCDRTWRQVKLAGGTVTHLLAYPFVMIAQAVQHATRQLKSGNDTAPELGASSREVDSVDVAATNQAVIESSEKPLALSPSSDQSIRNILLIAAEEVQGSTAFSVQRPAFSREIRGIASQVRNRQLVLVGQDNQILNCLSFPQRQLLTRYIRMELTASSASKLSLSKPVLSISQVLPEHVQSDLASGLRQIQRGTTAVSRYSSQYVLPLVNRVTATLSKVTGDLQQSWNYAWQVSHQTALEVEHHAVQSSFEFRRHQFKTLIWAAMDHFFNQHVYQLDGSAAVKPLPKSSMSSPTYQFQSSEPSESASRSALEPEQSSSKFTFQPVLRKPKLSQPFSPSKQVLFRFVTPSHQESSTSVTPNDPRENFPQPLQSPKKNQEQGTTTFKLAEPSASPDSGGSEVTPVPTAQPTTFSTASNPTIQPISGKDSPVTSAANQESLLEGGVRDSIAQDHPLQAVTEPVDTEAFPRLLDATEQVVDSNWVEAQVSTVAYEKHALERILGWLDGAILWIENVILKVWHKVEQWFSRQSAEN